MKGIAFIEVLAGMPQFWPSTASSDICALKFAGVLLRLAARSSARLFAELNAKVAGF
jgi:hypothetical protein